MPQPAAACRGPTIFKFQGFKSSAPGNHSHTCKALVSSPEFCWHCVLSFLLHSEGPLDVLVLPNVQGKHQSSALFSGRPGANKPQLPREGVIEVIPVFQGCLSRPTVCVCFCFPQKEEPQQCLVDIPIFFHVICWVSFKDSTHFEIFPTLLQSFFFAVAEVMNCKTSSSGKMVGFIIRLSRNFCILRHFPLQHA